LPPARVFLSLGRCFVSLAAQAALLVTSVSAYGQTAAVATGAPHALFIDILQGEGALNDVRARTAREPIVEIRDENHKPVAGVVVLFVVDNNTGGLGATFNGAQAFSTTTGADGQAVGRGFQITKTTGRFHISIDARQGNLHTRAVINEVNVLQVSHIALVNELATVASSKAGLIALLEIAAVGAVGGVVAATNPASPVTITTGTGTVGPPTTPGIRIYLHGRRR
jgi:hypothetical protein